MRLVCFMLIGVIQAACAGQCGSRPRTPELSVEFAPAILDVADEFSVRVRIPHALTVTDAVLRIFLEGADESAMDGYVAQHRLPAAAEGRAREVDFRVSPYRAPGRYDLAARLFAATDTGETLLSEQRFADAVELRGGVALELLWSAAVTDSIIASPTVVDVNGDGVLDIIVATGLELQYGTTVALDGRDGGVLWRRDEGDEVISSPAVAKIGSPGEMWLFNGGRAGYLLAVRAADGKTMWKHNFHRWVASPAIADVDGDGRLEVVAVAGGTSGAFREGRLFVFDAETGDIRWSHSEPIHGQEYYASPGVADVSGNGRLDIVIGSGGEHEPGATILFENDGAAFHRAWAVPTRAQGIEASPLLVDVTGDGLLEVITASMDGSISALRGKDGSLIWQRSYPGYEFYPSPGAGDVDGDGRLTIVAAGSRGAFPNYHGGLLVAIDARTGEERWKLERGHIAGGSPLLVDLTGDGRAEVLTTMGGYTAQPEGLPQPSRLLVLRGRDARIVSLTEVAGMPISTPLVTDLDGNGRLDIVVASYGRGGVYRYGTPFTVSASPGWWKFRGDLGNTGDYGDR